MMRDDAVGRTARKYRNSRHRICRRPPRRVGTVGARQSQVTISEMLFAMSQRPRIKLPQMIT